MSAGGRRPQLAVGQPLPRVDGPAKVTGAARYAADFAVPGAVYAQLIGSPIARGRIECIESTDAERAPGVLAVLSFHSALRLPYLPQRSMVDPPEGERLHVLQDDRVHFLGQPVAIAVAHSAEQAAAAAALVRVSVRPEPVSVQLAHAPGAPESPDDEAGRGDTLAALADAAVRIDQVYEIARENHHPLELHAVTAAWSDGQLRLWSKSQFVQGERAELAAVFGIPPEAVRVISPFVGGAFGCALRSWPHVALCALAARQLGRPVKLVLTRRQLAALTGYRPPSRQRVVLGAQRDGRLTALVHEAEHPTSRYERYTESIVDASLHLYACPAVRTRYRVVPLDVSTPTYMRGPGEASGAFALECALDELALELELDPVELRLRNEPERDQHAGKRYSSRSLRECYRAAGERFGWAGRDPRPRSMREAGLLIGWGVAAASYPARAQEAHARVRLHFDGSADVETSGSDMGPGTYTSLGQLAADALGLPLERVRVRLGDSSLPAAPPHGGSMTLASIGPAVQAACSALRAELLSLAVKDYTSPLWGAEPAEIDAAAGQLFLRRAPSRGGESYTEILERHALPSLQASSSSAPPVSAEHFSAHGFGAIFAEVAVDPELGETRVRRLVGAYGVGRVVNPRLARSQCLGAMVGGIGMALLEDASLDPRDGRVVAATLGEYLVPVNKDVEQLEALFVEERDPHVNALGAKGLGELGFVGVAPAIANAVFHATGRRIRALPIRLEQLL